ncbi:MAG: ACT domain-containing protein [Nocardioidaceae bacterium]
MSHLLRVSLPDVPGSLGAVATALGLAGANITAIEVVEQRPDGSVVDDVFVDFEPGVMPDMVVSAVQRLDGAHVEWVSRYAAAGNLHLDLEAIEVITADPAKVVERLVDVLPLTFRSDWAMMARLTADQLEVVQATGGAPDLPPECRTWFPVKHAFRPEIPAGWSDWGSAVVAVAPFGDSMQAVLFGRRGGPEILDSELARLNHLAAVAATIEAVA